jgi:hypothetical protein
MMETETSISLMDFIREKEEERSDHETVYRIAVRFFLIPEIWYFCPLLIPKSEG